MDDQPQPPAEAVAADVVVLEGLTKRFGDHLAVDGIDLRIGGGEFFSLLGPSGCGKTTTLRMIAGFEEPTDGRVLIDGVDVSRTGPERRPVNTVFQSYALFPHLTVAENVALGDRRQPWRLRTRNLEEFSSGEVTVLVATDIAARGIHIDDVELVVHVDPPAEQQPRPVPHEGQLRGAPVGAHAHGEDNLGPVEGYGAVEGAVSV